MMLRTSPLIFDVIDNALIVQVAPTSSPAALSMILQPSGRDGTDWLKLGKALGPDDISPRLLKNCSTELCQVEFAFGKGPKALENILLGPCSKKE